MTIPALLKQLDKTTAQWKAEDPVLDRDQIGIEVMSNGYNRFKRGDGVKRWTELPYLDKLPPGLSE